MYIGDKDKENNSNTNKTISIYTQGKYTFGYKYNVNHPIINELYHRYKEQHGIAHNHPMTNAQRADFEKFLDKYFDEHGITN